MDKLTNLPVTPPYTFPILDVSPSALHLQACSCGYMPQCFIFFGGGGLLQGIWLCFCIFFLSGKILDKNMFNFTSTT